MSVSVTRATNWFLMIQTVKKTELSLKLWTNFYAPPSLKTWTVFFVTPSMEPEQFLLNSSRVWGPVLETSGGATERDGRPLQPHTDVYATRLHGGLDTTSQVTSNQVPTWLCMASKTRSAWRRERTASASTPSHRLMLPETRCFLKD